MELIKGFGANLGFIFFYSNFKIVFIFIKTFNKMFNKYKYNYLKFEI